MKILDKADQLTNKFPKWLIGYIVLGVIVSLAMSTYTYATSPQAQTGNAPVKIFSGPSIFDVLIWPYNLAMFLKSKISG